VGYRARLFEEAEELNRRAILDAAFREPGCTMLDLGCGDGAFTLRVSERVGSSRVLGLEMVDHLADEAAARGIEVVRGNLAEPLPFGDGSVDVIHSNQVIEHLVGTDHFMREIRRVLRPGGWAVVSTNNLASLHNIAALVAGWQPTPAHISDEAVGLGNPIDPHAGAPGAVGQMHLRLFTGRGLAALATYHGLRVELERAAGFYPLPPRAARLVARVLPRWGAFLVQRYRRPD
jgi:SAM-dependent methyltransferase